MLKIAVIGTLIDTDLVLAEILLRQGEDVVVLREKKISAAYMKSAFYMKVSDKNIRVFSHPLGLLMALRNYDFVYSITSSLFFKLKLLAVIYPVLVFLGWPRYAVLCSGSNITERSVEHSIGGILERFSLKHSFCNIVNNYPFAIKNAVALRLKSSVFLPFPYLMDLDSQDSDTGNMQMVGKLIMFHASNLDWGLADSSPKRNSTKGNNRFIRAFIKACKDRLNAHCIILERGPDCQNAKKLISELNGKEFFTWKADMPRAEFHKTLNACDVIIDQFDLGGYGGIAVEAMAYGKPVMVYVDTECNNLVFNNDVPVINVHTENDIEHALHSLQDRKYLQKIGMNCKDWVRRYFDINVIGQKYIIFARLACGK